MLFKTLAFAALFVASASASTAFDLHERHADLEERNGASYGAGGRTGPPTAAKGGSTYQFAPGIQTATGDTCAAAFGGGYQTCREASDGKNRLCYNPDAGQKCCSASWSCPNGSFCLSDGVCCPDGMDPASCGAAAEASSSAAAAASSTTVATSSAVSFTKVKPSVTTSASIKVLPSTFVNISSAGGAVVPTNAPSEPAPAQATINSAPRDSLPAAGLVGAGLLAVLAAY